MFRVASEHVGKVRAGSDKASEIFRRITVSTPSLIITFNITRIIEKSFSLNIFKKENRLFLYFLSRSHFPLVFGSQYYFYDSGIIKIFNELYICPRSFMTLNLYIYFSIDDSKQNTFSSRSLPLSMEINREFKSISVIISPHNCRRSTSVEPRQFPSNVRRRICSFTSGRVGIKF